LRLGVPMALGLVLSVLFGAGVSKYLIGCGAPNLIIDDTGTPAASTEGRLIVRAAAFPDFTGWAQPLPGAVAWWLGAAAVIAACLGVSALALWVWQKYRFLARRLDEEERYRGLIVDELGHRVRNKLAAVYAALSYELRDCTEIWSRVDVRLRALADTDELIARFGAEGADIDAILETELRPYGLDRVALSGGCLQLPPRLAVSLALIVHELTTNAAKYGALSTPAGRIGISWAKTGSRVVIEWEEAGGPPTALPSREGSGKRLLERGLAPFHGAVATRFGPGGFACTIGFAVPNEAKTTLRAARSYASGTRSSIN
jgi:two-component sensor histidine kinase